MIRAAQMEKHRGLLGIRIDRIPNIEIRFV